MALFSCTGTVSGLSKFGLISVHEWIIPAVETWRTAAITAVICSIHFLNYLSTIINVFTGNVMLPFQLLQCSRKLASLKYPVCCSCP